MTPKTALAQRLQEVCPMGDFADFGQIAGVSRKTAAKYLRGETAPAPDALQKIADATGCDLHWLITGQKSPRAAEHEPRYQGDDHLKLPIVGRIRADPDGIPEAELTRHVHGPPQSGPLGLLRVDGAGLAPLALDGHHVILDLEPRDPVNGELQAAFLADGRAPVGRCYRFNGVVLFCEVHPWRPRAPLRLKPDEIDHVHVVLGVLFC